MKRFQQGCILGRFQPLHKGHASLIVEALKQCEKVLVFIGSSQAKREPRNPFSYEERCAMLKTVFGDAIEVRPLPDLGLGDVHAWGDHIIDEAAHYGFEVDCFILGEELKNDKWFSSGVREKITLLEINRLGIPISATMVREAFLQDEKKTIEEYLPEGLLPKYEDYRQIILESCR